MPIIATPVNRKYEQADLLCTVGMFFLPFLEAADTATPLSDEETTKLRAKLHNDFYALREQIDKFAKGEAGADYSMVATKYIHDPITELWHYFHQKAIDKDAFRKFESLRIQVINGILRIPVDVGSRIFQARTPFQTYKFLKSVFVTTARRIQIVDRYLDSTLFYRYLSDIQSEVDVTVVTSPQPDSKQRKDAFRYAAFMDASRLFAEERTHERYTLKTSDEFHDRWVRCDDVIYVLGGSLKQLDAHFTVSKVDATSANSMQFEKIISQASKVFGWNVAPHP